jgi:MFS family permease
MVGRRSLAGMLGGLSLLGPLSINAYLPAFADIQRDFQASTAADLQLTLTGYLLAFACMSLVHGPLSDAFGRRRVILCALLASSYRAEGDRERNFLLSVQSRARCAPCCFGVFQPSRHRSQAGI